MKSVLEEEEEEERGGIASAEVRRRWGRGLDGDAKRERKEE